MFVEEKVYNHMTKIAEQWWQMVIAEKNNTRQVISPSPRHEWMESRETDWSSPSLAGWPPCV